MSYPETTLERATTRDEARVLFAQTMGLVAVTAGLFAVGAYLGRNMSNGAGFLWFIAAFVCLLGMNFAIQKSEQLAIGLLFGFGVLVGLDGPHDRVLREHQPAGRLAGRWGDSALHRRLRGRRLRDSPRPAAARSDPLLGAARADRVRDRHDLRAHPERLADLRGAGVGDLRGLHDDRLPASAEVEGHPGRAVARGVDLPGHPQRLPFLPDDLRPPQLIAVSRR